MSAHRTFSARRLAVAVLILTAGWTATQLPVPTVWVGVGGAVAMLAGYAWAGWNAWAAPARYPWSATFSGLAVFGLAVAVFGWLPTDRLDGLAGLVAAAGGGTAGLQVVRYAWTPGTGAQLTRWAYKLRKTGGVASRWDHLRVAGRIAMLRRARVLRPSLEGMSLWAIYRQVPVTEYATELARDGRRRIYSPCEDVTLRVGGPRTGKTGELACRIVDAPGAVIATSTRTDLVELTAPLREKRGPVHIFNPGGLGNWASTVKWSPLVGCRVPRIAQDRASDMIPTSTTPDGERWDVQARGVLSTLMHAAALGGVPMRAVLAWVSDPNPKTSGAEVDRLLERSRESRSMRLAAEQFFTLNDRTKTSITTAIMPALRWLLDSRAAALGDELEEGMVDVKELLDQHGTVYLLGGEDGLTASLIAAFTAEIARQARALAAASPKGRLDPPLTIALDEAALVCPVPLDRWTADMGGRNITIHISIQSRAQLIQRWGREGAASILNNTATILVYGGTRDREDLEVWSSLSGEREVIVENKDADGAVTGTTTRKEPVLSPSRIANLPAGTCMVIRRGMPACLGRTTMAWKRKDVRAAVAASPFRSIIETAYEYEAGDLDEARP